MEPETQPVHPALVALKRYYPALILCLAVAAGTLALIYTYGAPAPESEPAGPARFLDSQGNEIEPLAIEDLRAPEAPFPRYEPTGDYVYDAPSQMLIRLDADWEIASSTALPDAVTDPYYAIARKDGSCAAVLIQNGAPVYDAYDQTTYSGQIYGYDDLMSFGRRINKRYAPDGYAFKKDTFLGLAFMPGEVVDAYMSSNQNRYVLFAPEGQALTLACVEDFASMVRTAHAYYPPVALNEGSVGDLWLKFDYIEKETTFGSSATLPPDDNGVSIYFLYFRESDAAPIHLVRVMADLAYGIEPAIYRNALWYVSRVRGLVRTDIASGEEQVIIPRGAGDAEMNDFYISGDKLFYLQGTWCNGYMDRCDLTLMESTVTGADPRVLAEHVSDRQIVGFDAAAQKLYLVYWDGDAGEVWGEYEAYDFATGTMSKVADASEYFSDTPSEAIKAFKAKLASLATNSRQLHVEKGTFSPMEGEEGDTGFRFFK